MSIRQPAEPVPLAEAVLELSNERDGWLRRLLAAWREGFRAGHKAGFEEGFIQAEADWEAAWQQIAGPIARPGDGPARRLRAAEAGERRDQAEHERAFVARAYNTPPAQRTHAQAATVLAYPPPDPVRRGRPRARARVGQTGDHTQPYISAGGA